MLGTRQSNIVDCSDHSCVKQVTVLGERSNVAAIASIASGWFILIDASSKDKSNAMGCCMNC